MENDRNFLNNQFSGIVFENTIKNILNTFEEIMNLLDEHNIFKLQAHFKNLRGVFGKNFTEKAVVKIEHYCICNKVFIEININDPK